MSAQPSPPPWTPQQTLQWNGVLDDLDEPNQSFMFICLAGPGRVNPTAGLGANISVIPKPRRLGFTMPTGFDPMAMDVPIRFDNQIAYRNWPAPGARNGKRWAQTIDDQIEVLEWMAGRGSLYANGTHPAQGDPPQVQVGSFDGMGNLTNLIPRNWQSTRPKDIKWLVTNISYDNTTARTDRYGNTIFLDATVSLIQYIGVLGAPTAVSQRQKARGNVQSYVVVTASGSVDTIMKLCQNRGLKKASDWQTVITFNLGLGGKIRSYTQKLSPGTSVLIPTSLTANGHQTQRKDR
jgi:hypothetical protein